MRYLIITFLLLSSISGQNILWMKTYPCHFFATPAVAIDQNQDVIVGYYPWLIRYTSFGDIVWAIDKETEIRDVAIDSERNIILLFYEERTVEKCNYLGEPIWRKRLNFHPWKLTIDRNRNIFVLGGLNQVHNITTMKLTPNGDSLWIRSYWSGIHGAHFPGDIAINQENSAVITGGIPVISDWDILTLVYNSEGETLWSRLYDTSGGYWDVGSGIAIDTEGNIIVTGSTEFVSNCEIYGIILKYDKNGTLLWVKIDTFAHKFEAVACDYQNNIFLGGWKDRRKELWSKDFVITKYDKDGNFIWRVIYDNNGHDDNLTDLAVDSFGNVVVVGTTYGDTSIVCLTMKLEGTSFIEEKNKGNFIKSSKISLPSFIEIYDVCGKRLKKIKERGIYFLKAISKRKLEIKKFIFLK